MSLARQKFSHRIEAIDMLRGFALLGIVLVHMVEQYYAGPAPQAVAQAYMPSVADQITQAFVGIFILGKFYMIFSFLFGLSFFIQLTKTDSDWAFILRFAWRLVLLFLIGLFHHLHYRGDILTIYAVLGFGLLFFYRLSDRFLLICALLLIFNIPSLLVRSAGLFLGGEENPFNFPQDELMAYYETVKSGSYFEIWRANLNGFIGKMIFQVTSGRIYITFGLFLLGIYAGRKKLFENLEAHLPFFRKVVRYSLFGILGCILLTALTFGTFHLLKVEVTQLLGILVGGFIYDVFNAALATLYISWLLLLFQKEKWQKRLLVFYPVGRMGLTTYLMQTMFGTLLFFSYGLGLIYTLGAFYSFVAGLFFFAFQILFARWWFQRFAYGPVEWLWRMLTYFKFQSITLKNKTNLPGNTVASTDSVPLN